MKRIKHFLLLSVSLLLIVALMGCSAKEATKPSELKKPKAEDSVKKYFEALKTLDRKTIEEYSPAKNAELDKSKDDKQAEELLSTMLGKMEYKIEATNEDGDKAKSKVKVNVIDMEKFMAQYLQKALAISFKGAADGKQLSKEDQQKACSDIMKEVINSKDCAMKENNVDVNLTLKDGKWVIDNGEDVMKAIFDIGVFEKLNKK